MTNVWARLLTLPFRRFYRVPWKPCVNGRQPLGDRFKA
jgi:hypothetical protein